MSFVFDRDAYIQRLGLTPAVNELAGYDLLRALARAQVYSIPFENYDVFVNARTAETPEQVFDKLVTQKRGGWCFELNSLLALALEEFGFPLRTLMARNTWVPNRPRTHQVLLVGCEGETYLVDSGFGGQTPREPLLLRHGQEAVQGGQPFRLELREDHESIRASALSDEQKRHLRPRGTAVQYTYYSQDLWHAPHWVLQTRIQGEWRDLYQFTLESFESIDFRVAGHFHTSAPDSSFTQARVASLPTPGGRRSLTNNTFKEFRATEEGEVLVSEDEVASTDQLGVLLWELFGLSFSAEGLQALYTLQPAPLATQTQAVQAKLSIKDAQ